MIVKIKDIPKVEDYFHKECKLGYDDIEYALLFDYNHQFISILEKTDKGPDIYKFNMDEVSRESKTSTVRTLDGQNQEDRYNMLAALEKDYGFLEVEIIDRNLSDWELLNEL